MAYILIVDDDEGFASVLVTVLEDRGHEVHMELDPEAGSRSMIARTPDLVILDVMFPEDSRAGSKLARRMRGHDETLRNVPITMLTAVNEKLPLGFGQHDMEEECLPISAFIEKPVDLNALVIRIDEELKTDASEAAGDT